MPGVFNFAPPALICGGKTRPPGFARTLSSRPTKSETAFGCKSAVSLSFCCLTLFAFCADTSRYSTRAFISCHADLKGQRIEMVNSDDSLAFHDMMYPSFPPFLHCSTQIFGTTVVLLFFRGQESFGGNKPNKIASFIAGREVSNDVCVAFMWCEENSAIDMVKEACLLQRREGVLDSYVWGLFNIQCAGEMGDRANP